MKKLFPFLVILLILASCNSGTQTKSDATTNKVEPKAINTGDLKFDIEALNTFFQSEEGKTLDKVKAATFIEKCEQYVAAFPTDPIGGTYLFRAGEVARALGRYEDAIVLMNQVGTDYSTNEKAAPALFLKAFTYEENLNDTASAKKYYEEFLSKYPEHKLTGQVRQLLKVVETSPEDLIKQFKAKNR